MADLRGTERSRWVFETVEDPKGWWDGIVRRWERRTIISDETLDAYARRCAAAQFVYLPPHPYTPPARPRPVKAKIQDKEGIPNDQERAVKAKVQVKEDIPTDQQHAVKAKIHDKEDIRADQQHAVKAIQDKEDIRRDRELTWS